MLSTIRKRKEGFTIIELLIVLAIAGLILLIVFLAVPALQRNARNTQRNNDVSSILGAVSNFITNNGGTVPTGTAADADGVSIDITGAAGSNSIPAKLGFYTPATANISVAAAAPASFPDKDHVVIVTGFTCNSTGTDIGAASSRTAVALYSLEPSVKQCKEQ